MVLLTATKGQEKSTLEIAGAYKQEDTIEREKCKNWTQREIFKVSD